jgi:hypothetical protein
VVFAAEGAIGQNPHIRRPSTRATAEAPLNAFQSVKESAFRERARQREREHDDYRHRDCLFHLIFPLSLL